MTEHAPLQQKRFAPETSAGINGLIAACNRNDRFKLLDDDSVLPGNLDNSVHPAFHWFDGEGPMRQMLQLASHFISHDTLLTFFIPLLYGRELTVAVGHAHKNYLSDPLAKASKAKRGQYLAGVREALHCIGHSVSFQFQPPAKRVYARTMRDTAKPSHATSCCPAFQRQYSCRIELAECFREYYSTGVLRRGNLNEPHIQIDCPETEWGYGWEHFMFGSIMNPQDKTKPGTHLLMRKIWAEQTLADNSGGKEYCDVPMSYIAQWFRRKTWSVVAEQGPTAVAVPPIHFKIQSSNQYGAWIVASYHPEIKKDLETLHSQWKRHARRLNSHSVSAPPQAARLRCPKILWRPVNKTQLQVDNVPVPRRQPSKLQPSSTCVQSLTQTVPVCSKPTKTLLETKSESLKACHLTLPSSFCMSRKRLIDLRQECGRVKKASKR
ncbi:hypothetical protein GT037_003148 [Alternaria burnsii]|uniref:Uncharacterized protein n=1 Tax=Alternaria burnsii TaxID=1187904 RepID=A0A8H7BDM1_9PLEO|nr:uncharacterized protein GT037_003148 [Alternaria burnsii]KAF7679400.1 hypothetical protein GT037_003148 [Alternaria burnsii]